MQNEALPQRPGTALDHWWGTTGYLPMTEDARDEDLPGREPASASMLQDHLCFVHCESHCFPTGPLLQATGHTAREKLGHGGVT